MTVPTPPPGHQQPTAAVDAAAGDEVEPWVRAALEQSVALAVDNALAGQFPFAAVLVRDGEVLATGVNTIRADLDPTAHAEVAAVKAATRAGVTDLAGAVMVSSCEPCGMCHIVCAAAGIRRLVYAAPKEWVPADDVDRTIPRQMQAALRELRPSDITYVETPGATAPFEG